MSKDEKWLRDDLGEIKKIVWQRFLEKNGKNKCTTGGFKWFTKPEVNLYPKTQKPFRVIKEKTRIKLLFG